MYESTSKTVIAKLVPIFMSPSLITAGLFKDFLASYRVSLSFIEIRVCSPQIAQDGQ